MLHLAYTPRPRKCSDFEISYKSTVTKAQLQKRERVTKERERRESYKSKERKKVTKESYKNIEREKLQKRERELQNQSLVIFLNFDNFHRMLLWGAIHTFVAVVHMNGVRAGHSIEPKQHIRFDADVTH